MKNQKTRIRYIVSVLAAVVFAMALSGCGDKKESKEAATPTMAQPTIAMAATDTPAPTAEPTATPTPEETPGPEPSESVTPEPTEPVMSIAPTAFPLPTETPLEKLPAVSKDSLRSAIDKEITTNASAYAYEEKTTYTKTGRCELLTYFPNSASRNITGDIKEEVCYRNADMEAKKQVFLLADGKQVTLYTTKNGYALDYPGAKRDYILTYAEDSAGRCIYSAEYYSQWHICYRYDSAGKLATLARYNGDSLYGYEEYSYDAAGKLIFIRYHETDGSVYTETFVYDDAGNCVAFIPAGGFNDGNRIEYSYQKDDRGRLGSWTELRLESSTGKIEKTVYTVKYFTDGYVLVYRDADKDTLIEGDVFVPSSKLRDALNTVSGLSFRNSLLSTDVLPESAEMDDYRYSDYDSESFFGLPHDYKIGMRREWYRGQLPRDILIFGAWNYNPGDPTTSGVWYNWYETNKGELLTGVYSQEGNGGYTEYRYDESNRLVQEDYLNFTEDRTVIYRYDSQGHLVEREREFADTDTITGLDIHTKTVYRYTYNEGNTLDGMTAEVVSVPGNEKLSSTVLTVYKDRSSATISYGDLTQYLGMKASDLIRTVGKNYSYEPDYATDVALTFDGSVIFYIQDSSDTLNPDGKVGAIRVFYSSDIPSSGRNLGNGIHFGMKYSEIKAVFGAALGTPSASELDPGSELLYDSAVVGGYYYLFTWGPNAVENDEQPAVVLIKQEG